MTDTPDAERELTLARDIDVPRHKLFRCWTEPELLKQWFTPRPWTTPVVETDLRPGGASRIVMRGPDGAEHVNLGVYLEVVRDEKLVFTDAFTSAWVPSGKAFMVGTITFEDLGRGRTRYLAVVSHWSAEDCAAHEARGFHQGWGLATDQLVELASTL